MAELQLWWLDSSGAGSGGGDGVFAQKNNLKELPTASYATNSDVSPCTFII